MLQQILGLLWSLVMIGAILVLAYLCTRFVASRGVGERFYRGNLITVLEKVPVGRDQKLLLVKLGEEYYFLGAGPSGKFQSRRWKSGKRQKKTSRRPCPSASRWSR
mgnify:CR=1 FL=1